VGCLREGTGSPATRRRVVLTGDCSLGGRGVAALWAVRCCPALWERRDRIAIGKEDRDPAATCGFGLTLRGSPRCGASRFPRKGHSASATPRMRGRVPESRERGSAPAASSGPPTTRKRERGRLARGTSHVVQPSVVARDDTPGRRDRAHPARPGASRKPSTSAVNESVAVSIAACRCPGMIATRQSGRASRSAWPAAWKGSLLSPP
jgi:hypothetical protein